MRTGNEQMTSKERVMAAISHVEPDRVPIGELEIDAPIVEQVLGRPTFYGSRLPLLKAYWEGRRDEVVDSMKRDYVEFIRKTGFDIAEVRLVPDKDARFIPMTRSPKPTSGTRTEMS
jgi:uroporphyrinogen decarboxylase